MATIEKRGNSYRIKVSCGYDAQGKQVTQRMTWSPEPGMTARQIEKELQRQTVLFEEACMQGNMVATIKFEDFARQWFKEYAAMRLKESTLQGYHTMEARTYKAIGHIRLEKLTTRHIQKFKGISRNSYWSFARQAARTAGTRTAESYRQRR